MKKMTRKFALLSFITMFIVQIVGSIVPAASTINQEGNGTITYTLAYQRTSRQFAGTTAINLFDNDYNVDPAPGTSLDDTINTDLYRVTATHVQTPVYTETAENYTTVRVLGNNLVNDSTHVNQTEDFIIPEDENALWKLVGNMETRPSQLNATSIDMALGTTTDPSSRLNVRDSLPLTFTAERGGDYRTEKYMMLLNTGGVNYTTHGDMSVINTVYQNQNTLRTSDSDGTGLDYTLGGTDGSEEDDYYSMFFATGLTTTASRIQIRRYSYLYSNNFVVTPTIWFKVYAMDWGMSEITGDEEYDTVYEWERSRNTYHNAGQYYTNSIYLDLEPEHFNQIGQNYMVYLRVDAGMDWTGIALTGQRVLDWTTVLTMQQQDLCVDGVLEFDDIGVDGIHSPAEIKLRETTNMNGAYYHYTGGAWTLLQSVTGDSVWHDHDLADVALDADDPKIRFLFYKESLPITFSIDYCNVSAFIVPVTVAINITHDGGGLGNQVEELDMSLISAEYDDAFNFTVEYTISSDDFALWDHDNPCYVADQLLNLTFTSLYFLPRVWITWSIFYSLNSYETPSVLNVACNDEFLSDTSMSAGLTEFAEWQSNLAFESNEECYARVTIDADLSLERTLTFVSRTLYRDQWDLEGITNATITRIEIEGVYGIAQIYIGGTAYGTDPVILPNYALQRGSRLYLSIVLLENIYKPVKFLDTMRSSGTISVDIFSSFNQHYLASMSGAYDLEYSLPAHFTANQTQIALTDEVSQTYWNENFGDNAWDGGTVTKNNESSMTVANNNATLQALNNTNAFPLNLTLFANGNLTRNGTSTSVYDIGAGYYDSLDGIGRDYNESRTMTNFNELQGTGTWDKNISFKTRNSVQRFTDCSYYVIVGGGPGLSHLIGSFEFWFYFEEIEYYEYSLDIIAGYDSSNLWYIPMSSTGEVGGVTDVFEPGVWNHCKFAFSIIGSTYLADVFINNVTILDDVYPVMGGIGLGVTMIGFITDTSDLEGAIIALDAMGCSWDAGYSQGENWNYVTGTPDPTKYEMSDSNIRGYNFAPGDALNTTASKFGKLNVMERHPSAPVGYTGTYTFPTAIPVSSTAYLVIECWLRMNIQQEDPPCLEERLVFRGVNSENGALDCRLSSFYFNFEEIGGQYTFPQNVWTHVKFRVQETHVFIYWNGVAKGSYQYWSGVGPKNNQFTGFSITDTTQALGEYQIASLGIVGVNGYNEGDMYRYRHLLNVTGNNFEDGLSNYPQITLANSGDIHLESTTVHTGLKGVHYILPNMTQPNDAIMDYTFPCTTWNSFSFWIRFPTDADETLQYTVTIDDGAGNDIGSILFYDRDFTTRQVYYQADNSDFTLWLAWDSWNYNTWYKVTFLIDWENREYTLAFNGYSNTHAFSDAGACTVASRARFFRGYSDPQTSSGMEAFIDDLELEFNNLNYIFTSPESTDLELDITIYQVMPIQGVYFYVNSTRYAFSQASQTQTFSIHCMEANLCFTTTLNFFTVEITARYTALCANVSVQTTCIASDLDYVQALRLNFTAETSGGAHWHFQSGTVSLEYQIVTNGTYSVNITAGIFNAGKDLDDLNLAAMLITFYVDLNNTCLVLDNILLFDESQAFYINGTRVPYDPGDGCAYYTSTAQWTNVHYAITRLSDDSYSISVNVNATWAFNITNWAGSDTMDCEPGAALNTITTRWFLISHPYTAGTTLFVNGVNPPNTNMSSYFTYSQYAIDVSDASIVAIDIRGSEMDDAVLIQTTPTTTIQGMAVEYLTMLQAAETYSYHSVSFDDGLDITSVSITHIGTPLAVSREGTSNTFYWTCAADANDLFVASLVIDPNFDLDVEQTFNNGTNCTLDVSISSCIAVENVSVFVDLSNLEIYMQHWNLSGSNVVITQAENRIVNFTLPVVNETNDLVLTGWADVPVASIDRYAVEGFQFIDVDEEALYYGYLNFDVYSRAFRVNITQLGRDYVLDGVHYNGQVLDIDSAGLFTCSGWGTGISSAYVRFTAAPIARVTQTRVGNIIRVEVEADLPLEMANYVLNVEGETKRVTFQSSNYTWMNFNDTAFLIQGLTVNVGINVFYVEIKVIDPLENLIYVLPVVVILVIIVVIYLARKNKWTKESVTEAVKDAFTFKKKKKRSPKMKPTEEDDTTQKIVFDSARVEITAKKEANK